MGHNRIDRVTGLNTNGQPGRLTLLMNIINSREHMNDIFVLNDVRLQENETDRITLTNHNIIIANETTLEHQAGGCAILTPKGYFVTILETGNAEALLCKIQKGNFQITVGTHYAHLSLIHI